MGKTIPDWLEVPWDVLCYLVGGAPWPEGDEDALKRLAAGHRKEQQAAIAYKQNLERELASLRAAISGEAGNAIFERLGKLIDAAGKHAEHHGKIAESVDRFADATEETKEGIIEGLIAFAAQIAVELALSYFSAGISDLAAIASAVATRSVIVGLVRSLIERAGLKVAAELALDIAKIAARESLIGAGAGAGADALTQGGFMLAGHRDHFDMGKVGNSAEAGAVGGAVGGVAGRGAANLAGRALGESAATTGGRIAQGLVAGGVGGLTGGVAGAVDQGGLDALKHPDQILSGAALGAVMGGAAGVRSHVPVEGKGGTGPHVTPEESGIANLADQSHGGGKGDGHQEVGTVTADNSKRPPTTDTNGHAAADQPGHEQNHPDQQNQQPVQTTHEAARATPEAKPAPEQQRAATGGDPARGAPPNGERPVTGRDQPAPSTSGERPATSGTRLTEQPAASLSNTVGDKDVAGAASGATREAPVVKAVEPVTAKTSEPVRATAGLPEARPVEQRTTVEARAEVEQPRTHIAERTSPAEAPARHDAVSPQEAMASTATHVNGEAPRPAEPTAGHLADHPPQESHESKPAVALPNGTPHPTDPPPRHPPSGDGPRSGEHRAAWMRAALESGDLPRRPGRLKQLWDHLAAAEKDRLYLHDPMVGSRNGIPIADRAHYNEHELRRQHALDPADKRLANLVRALDAPSPEGRARASERLLVTFDPEGRSAIALGDPDKASHKAVFVGGTTADEGKYLPKREEDFSKPGSQGYIERAERMIDETRLHIDPRAGEKASVVIWLDYETPGWTDVHNHPGLKYAAEQGAPRLREFCESLRATDEGKRPGQTTVVGHSYGTRTVGEAAKAEHGGLDADRVVNLASPGMGVKGVHELALRGVDPYEVGLHIYSTIDPHDFLTPIKAFEDHAHGTMPHDQAKFGGIAFDSQPHRGWLGWIKLSAHMLYWEQDTAALVNTGLIIAGLKPFPLGETPRRG